MYPSKYSKQTFAGLAFILALILLWPALPAAALSWMPQTSGTTKYLLGVTYGGGKFVAVGLSNTILTSLDGVTWTAQTVTGSFRSVTYGGSQFVAVAQSGTIVTSPDGTAWTAQTTANALHMVVVSSWRWARVARL